MFALIRHLLGRPSRGQARTAPVRRSAAPTLEALEPRNVPSGSPVFMNHDGEVVIRGRHSADTVTVTQDWDKVVINYNGSSYSFDGGGVKSLLFKGRGGNDFFENDTAIRTVAKGGAGS